MKEGLIVALFRNIMKLNKSPTFIEFVSTSLLIDLVSLSELTTLAKESFNHSKLLMEASYLIFFSKRKISSYEYMMNLLRNDIIRMYSRLSDKVGLTRGKYQL